MCGKQKNPTGFYYSVGFFFFFPAFWSYKMFASSSMRLLLLLLALSRSHCHVFLTMTERVSSKHERHLDQKSFSLKWSAVNAETHNWSTC